MYATKVLYVHIDKYNVTQFPMFFYTFVYFYSCTLFKEMKGQKCFGFINGKALLRQDFYLSISRY